MNSDVEDDHLLNGYPSLVSPSTTSVVRELFDDELLNNAIIQTESLTSLESFEVFMDDETIVIQEEKEEEARDSPTAQYTIGPDGLQRVSKIFNTALATLITGICTGSSPDISIESNNLSTSLMAIAPAVFLPGYLQVSSLA